MSLKNIFLLVLVAFQTLKGQAVNTQSNARQGLADQVRLLQQVPDDKKPQIAPTIRRETEKHLGFALTNSSDLYHINVDVLGIDQVHLLDPTVMHVINGALIPAVVKGVHIVPKGDQLYPDLTTILKNNQTGPVASSLASVGRIRYGVKPTVDYVSNGYLAGTGFMIGPRTIATACHVLDAFLDTNTQAPSEKLWVAIDFGTDDAPVHAFRVSGVLGKSQIEGFDVALLDVENSSVDGQESLPGSLAVESAGSPGANLAVVGYPNFDQTAVCAPPKTLECDETEQYFYDYRQKNTDAVKLLSPGKRSSDSLLNYGSYHVFTYDASTLEGQSGSPVIDLATGYVAGIHYCCTGYAPNLKLQQSCEKIKPISVGNRYSNEGISIRDLYTADPFRTLLQH